MPLSVLLVDDNPHFLRVLNRFLIVHGAGSVQVVGSVVGGREAVAQATQLQPDVVVVDLKMPEVPGLALIPQLRRTLPNAIIIALSLMDPAEYGLAATAAGADAFVSKEQLECELLPTLQRLADRPSRRVTPVQEG